MVKTKYMRDGGNQNVMSGKFLLHKLETFLLQLEPKELNLHLAPGGC